MPAKVSRLLLVLILVGCHSPSDSSLPALPQISMPGASLEVEAVIGRAFKGVQNAPYDATQNGELGMILHAHDQLQPAVIMYQRSQQLDPTDYRWPHYYGIVLAQHGRFTAAIDALMHSVALSPGNIGAQLKLGELGLQAGDLELSETWYRKVIAVAPDNPEAHYGLGEIYLQRENLEQAIQSYARAVDLDNQFGAAHYGLSLVYRRQGEDQDAARHYRLFERFQGLRPLNTDPLMVVLQDLDQTQDHYVAVALEMLQRGNYGDAAVAFREVLERDPENMSAHINLMALYGAMGQIAKAEKHYALGKQIDDTNADLFGNFGVLMIKTKRYQAAIEALQQAVELNPSYADARLNLGRVYDQLGQMGAAASQYESILKQEPKHRQAHYFLAKQWLKKPDPDAAIRHLLQTLEPEDANTPSYLRVLANVYAQTGDYDQARLTLERGTEVATRLGEGRALSLLEADLQKLATDVHPQSK